MFQVHQGDVYIREISAIPAKAKPVKRENGRVILAHGEVTGHAHAIVNKSAVMFREDGMGGGASYLKIEGDTASVTHEEHARIDPPAGLYEVTIQAQYTPAEIQRVGD